MEDFSDRHRHDWKHFDDSDFHHRLVMISYSGCVTIPLSFHIWVVHFACVEYDADSDMRQLNELKKDFEILEIFLFFTSLNFAVLEIGKGRYLQENHHSNQCQILFSTDRSPYHSYVH